MHIAIVTSGYYALSGAFTHVRDISRYLVKQGNISVTVLSPDVEEVDSMPELHFIRIRDIPFVPQLLFFFARLVGLHHRQKIDILYSVDSIGFIAAVAFGRFWRVPTVFNFQASIFSPGRELDYSVWEVALFKFTNRLAACAADRVICVSQEMVRCALYAGAREDKVTLISNLVDLEPFQSIRRARGTVPDEPICLYVGALRPVKGLQFLIRALSAVLRWVPRTRLVLVGDGPDREKLVGLAQDLGVLHCLDFVGRLAWIDVLPYYKQADIFVLPSLSDPKPLVVLEALAAGLPVVGSRVDGIPEMVKDGYNGLLVPTKNALALSEALVRLLNDRGLYERCSRNALQTVQKFSWEKNIRKFITLYEGLLCT